MVIWGYVRGLCHVFKVVLDTVHPEVCLLESFKFGIVGEDSQPVVDIVHQVSLLGTGHPYIVFSYGEAEYHLVRILCRYCVPGCVKGDDVHIAAHEFFPRVRYVEWGIYG